MRKLSGILKNVLLFLKPMCDTLSGVLAEGGKKYGLECCSIFSPSVVKLYVKGSPETFVFTKMMFKKKKRLGSEL